MGFFLGLGLVFACSEPVEETSKLDKVVGPKTFFDLKGFIVSESDYLSESNAVLEKEISFKGKKERKTIEQVEWKKELSIFANSDINKAAWLDKYVVDSTANFVHYKTASPKIKTQSLKVFFDGNKAITKVEIENSTGNGLYDSSEWLEYDKVGKRYSIRRNQKVVFGDFEEIVILGEF